MIQERMVWKLDPDAVLQIWGGGALTFPSLLHLNLDCRFPTFGNAKHEHCNDHKAKLASI